MPVLAPVRVLLIDPDSARAARIDRELVCGPDHRFEVIPCRDLGSALAVLDSEGAEVALVSAALENTPAEQSLERLHRIAPDLPVVMLVTQAETPTIGTLLALGAEECLISDAIPPGLIGRVINHLLTRLRLLREQETRIGELRAAIESKNRALGVLAHDLRSPINIVLSALDLLELSRAEGGSPSDSASLSQIRQAVGFAQALIEDVLSNAVQEADTITLMPRWVDYRALIERVSRAHALLAEAKRVRVILDPPLPEALTGWGDPLKLEQLLANLIGNAVKFSYPEGRVRVSARQDAAEILLDVADEGDGIPPEIEARLFQPFCRGASGTAGEPTTGLGLYICARIAAAHGGAIAADSRPGQGTKVTVRLPHSCPDLGAEVGLKNSRKRPMKVAVL